MISAKSLPPNLISPTTSLFWFRRDLRIQDNAGLYHALKENKEILPIFIFDTEILDKLEDKNDLRVAFIHQSLTLMQKQLEEMGSSLLVFHGNPIEIFKQLTPNMIMNHTHNSVMGW
jgi:deoxyribodipyrimidine photo-lyase